eukprot:768529-Hanusia_phi.AAC.5
MREEERWKLSSRKLFHRACSGLPAAPAAPAAPAPQTATGVSNTVALGDKSIYKTVSARSLPPMFQTKFQLSDLLLSGERNVIAMIDDSDLDAGGDLEACSLAADSWVHVHIPSFLQEGESVHVTPTGELEEVKHRHPDGDASISYKLSHSHTTQRRDVEIRWALMETRPLVSGDGGSYITVSRYVTGHATDRVREIRRGDVELLTFRAVRACSRHFQLSQPTEHFCSCVGSFSLVCPGLPSSTPCLCGWARGI